MSRLLLLALFGGLVINTGCERCKQCTYSYTETVIVETPNGEVEEIITHENQILTKDGKAFSSECVKWKDYRDEDDKDNAFTIVDYYELEAAESELDNFTVQCVDL